MKADLVIVGAKIYTLDDRDRVVEALAIRDGLFVGVGSDSEIRGTIGPRTEVIDARGRVVIPGLIDTHVHQAGHATDLGRADMSRARSIADILEVVRNHASSLREGEWVLASGNWSPEQLAEGRYPDRRELDTAAPRHPVYLPRVGHAAAANSLALSKAGLRGDVADPPGGRFVRRNGELTGVLFEPPAMKVIEGAIPTRPAEDLAEDLVRQMRRFHSLGLTSVRDPQIGDLELEAYLRLEREGRMSIRTSAMLHAHSDWTLREFEEHLERWRPHLGYSSSTLRLDTLKLFVDGGASLRTAYLSRPYEGDPDNFGILTLSPEKLESFLRAGIERGWRWGAHAVGDAANTVYAEALAAVDREVPLNDRRMAVEHGYMATPDTEREWKRLGVVVAAQPSMVNVFGPGWLKHLGSDRAHSNYPLRRWVGQGLTVTGGSDSPTCPPSPWTGLWAATTRRAAAGQVLGASQTLDRWAALRLYTREAARMTFEEDIKGSIAVGRYGDLVVLNADYGDCSLDEIRNISAVYTVVGGRVVHEVDTP